jgi:hypothetical protein
MSINFVFSGRREYPGAKDIQEKIFETCRGDQTIKLFRDLSKLGEGDHLQYEMESQPVSVRSIALYRSPSPLMRNAIPS